MALIWRLESIPELRALSCSQKKEVWAATLTKHLRDPILLLSILPCASIVGVGGYLGSPFSASFGCRG